MAIYSPRMWWVAIALLLWAPQTQCREFTREDIREAMLSLVHMIRSSEDKLERHELREKGLGEQVKRMLANLDKKHRALEPLKGMISRLDERLSNVETILLQKEAREKTSQDQMNEALSNIQKTLVTLASPAPAPPADSDNCLTLNNNLIKKLDATNAKIDAVSLEIKNIKTSLGTDPFRAMCLAASSSEVNPLEKHITDAEKLLNKYELKLSEYGNSTANTVQTDFVPLSEVAVADEAWHSKMTEVMERQEKDVKKIQKLLSDAESMWKDLPRLADLKRATNETLASISNSTETLSTNSEMGTNKIVTKLREMGDRLVVTNEDIQHSLTQSNTMTERAYNDISRSYDALRAEVQLLTKSDQLIQETSDNVLATKKRLEYVVNQIIIQLGDIIRGQHRSTNRTVDDKLEYLETTITTNQTLAFKNLSSTLDSEMAQVWRQIGVMHQQILMSQETLNAFSNNTAQYVNSSTTTMDKVKTEVSGITARMIELGENMNYVLGRLSTVTQEFKMIASGLSATLNKAINNTTPTPMIEDAGPGPHRIASEEIQN